MALSQRDVRAFVTNKDLQDEFFMLTSIEEIAAGFLLLLPPILKVQSHLFFPYTHYMSLEAITHCSIQFRSGRIKFL